MTRTLSPLKAYSGTKRWIGQQLAKRGYVFAHGNEETFYMMRPGAKGEIGPCEIFVRVDGFGVGPMQVSWRSHKNPWLHLEAWIILSKKVNYRKLEEFERICDSFDEKMFPPPKWVCGYCGEEGEPEENEDGWPCCPACKGV